MTVKEKKKKISQVAISYTDFLGKQIKEREKSTDKNALLFDFEIIVRFESNKSELLWKYLCSFRGWLTDLSCDKYLGELLGVCEVFLGWNLSFLAYLDSFPRKFSLKSGEKGLFTQIKIRKLSKGLFSFNN